MKRLPEPNTEPYGEVLTLDIQWATKPVEEYDYKLKMWLWAADMIDDSHYIEFINGKHYVIDRGCCRLCTKKIKPYTKKYYQKHYDNGMKYSFLYAAENYYCEDCAREEATKSFFNDVVPFEVNRFSTMRDGETLETVVYADGSRLEEMTSQERPHYEN